MAKQTKQLQPLIHLTPEDKKLIVAVLSKAPYSFNLLNKFEQDFVYESAERYKRYGERFQVRGKQLDALSGDAIGLYIIQSPKRLDSIPRYYICYQNNWYIFYREDEHAKSGKACPYWNSEWLNNRVESALNESC